LWHFLIPFSPQLIFSSRLQWTSTLAWLHTYFCFYCVSVSLFIILFCLSFSLTHTTFHTWSHVVVSTMQSQRNLKHNFNVHCSMNAQCVQTKFTQVRESAQIYLFFGKKENWGNRWCNVGCFMFNIRVNI
jgi:hypothetical protein